MKLAAWMVVGWMGWTLAAGAADAAPTPAQLEAVAQAPAQLAELIRGASVEQVAAIVHDVVARIAALGLPDAKRLERIREVVRRAFAGHPSDTLALATALGAAMAEPAGGAITSQVVSEVQQSVIAAAGDDGSAAGGAFGAAYTAQQSPAPGAAGPATQKASIAPPAPPMGQQYEGLKLD